MRTEPRRTLVHQSCSCDCAALRLLRLIVVLSWLTIIFMALLASSMFLLVIHT